MILGFKKQIFGEPTWFREKILLGAGYAVVEEEGIFRVVKPKEYVLKMIKQIGDIKPKIHTIREDPHNRWKAGRSIQMVYRGPKYSIESHFNKDIPELERCVSVQTISIRWISIHTKPLEILTGKQISEMDSFTTTRQVEILIDGNKINYERLQILARNDGFNSEEDFLLWFSKDFKGKVIHWSDFKY